MKKILAIQITLLIVTSVGIAGLFSYTDTYNYIQSSIVSTTCLSCIKMDPIPDVSFSFEAKEKDGHPDFILENLSQGPIFIGFRKDVCSACEVMDPVLEDVFDVNFGKKETFYKKILFEGSNITFIHTNLDHTSKKMENAFSVYGGKGVPMFLLVTLGNNSGNIQPCYTVVYGTLALDNNPARKAFLEKIVREGIEKYDRYSSSYPL